MKRRVIESEINPEISEISLDTETPPNYCASAMQAIALWVLVSAGPQGAAP